MARWPTVTAKQYVQIHTETLRISGTILPGDYPLIGRAELVSDAEMRGLSTSQAYAAVNTAMAQPFMLSVNGHRATLASSFGTWIELGRDSLADRCRNQLPWSEWGALGGRPRKENSK